VERPGIGDSTPHLYDSIAQWADDIATLADHLGIERFGLIGLSGGGPYVLACAHQLPERVVAGVVLGGVAPTSGREAAAGGFVGRARLLRPFLELSREPLGTFLWLGINALHPFADQVFSLFTRFITEQDRQVLNRRDTRTVFIDDLISGSRKDFRAVIYDAILFFRPWGFSLREIRVPILFFQGDADLFVPFSHGAHLAALVPDARLRYRPDEGHLGGLDAAEESVEFILSHWPRGRGRRGRPGFRAHATAQDPRRE